mgnify:CR=1 FL=1
MAKLGLKALDLDGSVIRLLPQSMDALHDQVLLLDGLQEKKLIREETVQTLVKISVKIEIRTLIMDFTADFTNRVSGTWSLPTSSLGSRRAFERSKASKCSLSPLTEALAGMSLPRCLSYDRHDGVGSAVTAGCSVDSSTTSSAEGSARGLLPAR